MKIVEGNILPQIGIGKYLLNATKEELLCMIGNDYQEKVRKKDTIISIENAKFWISSDGKIDQIGVGKGFLGKYKDTVGIGTTLQEVGEYVEVGDTYELKFEKGICFELEDADDWDELTAPIEFIYVYRV